MNHIPVLEKEIVHTFAYLSDLKGGIFVDGTIGNAGHSISIIKKLNIQNKSDSLKLKILAIDKDQSAIKLSKQNIKRAGLSDYFKFVHDDFKNIKTILENIGLGSLLPPHPASPQAGEGLVDGVLLDLGVSSMQLDDSSRGFSFKNPDEYLDMRMDQSQVFSAKDVVNGYSKKELETILRDYGEERLARKIAENITAQRKIKPINTVGQLIEVIKQAVPMKEQFGRTHFATKTFQAIRIETNGELEGLKEAIIDFCDVLSPGGKLAIISFHSLEDRIVKQTFFDLANPCQCPKEMPCICGKTPSIKIITKKPIIASDEEINNNPRSRSAKLRIVEKLF